jgi:hypothetical protein
VTNRHEQSRADGGAVQVAAISTQDGGGGQLVNLNTINAGNPNEWVPLHPRDSGDRAIIENLDFVNQDEEGRFLQQLHSAFDLND